MNLNAVFDDFSADLVEIIVVRNTTIAPITNIHRCYYRCRRGGDLIPFPKSVDGSNMNR